MNSGAVITLPGHSFGTADPLDDRDLRDALLADLSKIADGTYLPCTERVPDHPSPSGDDGNGARSVEGGERTA